MVEHEASRGGSWESVKLRSVRVQKVTSTGQKKEGPMDEVAVVETSGFGNRSE